MIVTIGAGGSGVVPIEATAASMGVGAGTHIRIAEVIGTVVETMPAFNKEIAVRSAGGRYAVGGFEAHGVGQGIQCIALGAEREGGYSGDAGALGSDINIIECIGVEAVDVLLKRWLIKFMVCGGIPCKRSRPLKSVGTFPLILRPQAMQAAYSIKACSLLKFGIKLIVVFLLLGSAKTCI